MKSDCLPKLLAVSVVLALCLSGSTANGGRSGAARALVNGDVDHEVAGVARSIEVSPGGLPDPDLEPGFPVQAPHNGGTYHAGAAIHTLVADIDGDPELEIVVTALATGTLHAWNADGTVVSGRPPSGVTSGAGYAAAGNLEGNSSVLEVVAGFWGGDLVAFGSGASPLPGWPRAVTNYVSTPPALADVDGDGIEEIFLGEEDWKLHAYRADGSPLPGWPVGSSIGGQERHTPAIGDLDGDGDLEILSVSGWTTPGVYLLAFHHDGSTVSGFPVLFPNGHVDTFPAIGDVDGDLSPEIVILLKQSSYPWLPVVTVLSGDGTVERSWTASSTAPYGTAPALADLDGDTVPEIVVQTDGHLEAWDGSGTSLAGWPVAWSSRWLGNSSPVVGDVDGDASPDVVVTTQVAGSSESGEVRAFDRHGVSLPGFPKSLPLGSGAVPAIADFDLDGRNEILVTGSFWNLIPGSYDKLWAYDLGGGDHGAVQWGQFGGGPRNSGAFATAVILRLAGDALNWTAHDAATGYDVIRGDLTLLRATDGDFESSTMECVGDDVPGRSLGPLPDPVEGESFWYLVRPVTPLGSGTYDATGQGQVQPRDAEIALSSGACP